MMKNKVTPFYQGHGVLRLLLILKQEAVLS